ncbi:hypothetical protein L7F22_065566, partial [Adiantum nelumboides]|nr:hypothetical protein [Adiantum nelumboides]
SSCGSLTSDVPNTRRWPRKTTARAAARAAASEYIYHDRHQQPAGPSRNLRKRRAYCKDGAQSKRTGRRKVSRLWETAEAEALSRLLLGFKLTNGRLPTGGRTDRLFWTACFNAFHGRFSRGQLYRKLRGLKCRYFNLSSGLAKRIKLGEKHLFHIWSLIMQQAQQQCKTLSLHAAATGLVPPQQCYLGLHHPHDIDEEAEEAHYRHHNLVSAGCSMPANQYFCTPSNEDDIACNGDQMAVELSTSRSPAKPFSPLSFVNDDGVNGNGAGQLEKGGTALAEPSASASASASALASTCSISDTRMHSYSRLYKGQAAYPHHGNNANATPVVDGAQNYTGQKFKKRYADQCAANVNIMDEHAAEFKDCNSDNEFIGAGGINGAGVKYEQQQKSSSNYVRHTTIAELAATTKLLAEATLSANTTTCVLARTTQTLAQILVCDCHMQQHMKNN